MSVVLFFIDRFKLSQVSLLVLIATALLIINVSGDHVFNKVNNLKVVLVLGCLIPLSIFVLVSVKSINSRVLSWLALPILAMLPGALLSDFQFSYGFGFEVVSQGLCVLWAFVLFSALSEQFSDEYWKVIWIFVPTIYFVCIIAFLEKSGLAPLINIPLNPFEASSLQSTWQFDGIKGRVESTFGNINYFASFLIQLLPISSALFLITKFQQGTKKSSHRLSQVFAGLSVLLIISALFLTQTRSAIFASFLSMGLFLILLRKVGIIPRRTLQILGTLSAGLVGLLGLLMLESESDRFSLLLNKETWWPRTVPWRAALDSFIAAPFFGHGIGASYELFFEYVEPDSRLFSGNRSYNHVHNEILQILQEGGLFGIATYLAFWSITLGLGFKYIVDSQQEDALRILMAGLICGLLAYHIHGLFSVAPRMISSRIIAYSLLAILICMLLKQRTQVYILKQTENEIFTKASYIGVPLIIVLISSYLAPFLYGQYQYAHALTKSDRYQELIQLTVDHDDIYILDAAAKEAFDRKDATQLLNITRRAERIFTNYRQMPVYQAYALFWLGDIDEAYRVISTYQQKDRYNSLANSLLLAIAFEKKSQKGLIETLQRSIEYQACINKLLDCEVLNINLVNGRFALPFQIIDKGGRWNVLIDHFLLVKLLGIKDQLALGQLSNEGAFSSILGLLSVGQFFKPESRTAIPLGRLDYERLSEYLRIRNKSLLTTEQEVVLSNQLEGAMKLKAFLKKRALLLGLTNRILQTMETN
jgi:hypothetical protein